jgi:hypothetical protein
MPTSMYSAMESIQKIVFACLMIAFVYGMYYLDTHVLFYSTILSIIAYSIMYVYSKKTPIKRRHSDYYDDDTPLESNA